MAASLRACPRGGFGLPLLPCLGELPQRFGSAGRGDGLVQPALQGREVGAGFDLHFLEFAGPFAPPILIARVSVSACVTTLANTTRAPALRAAAMSVSTRKIRGSIRERSSPTRPMAPAGEAKSSWISMTTRAVRAGSTMGPRSANGTGGGGSRD